ncbi:hypothetical protein EKO27_g7219 [Xylaria grammica]|uniref:NAD(P)-binding domain-containing protein n=1 Tax=Xylaria grammica TaxID=363999 RepID=A0A439D0B6_9PEZI|nr:hypothetical protein EKO27_g7219 [Xylaria grammica]
MAEEKILVLGGTGPSGVCLLRELLSRNHMTVLFARNPTKIPADVLSNPLLEVVKGEMTDINALSNAVSKCRTVLSFLGPAATTKLANSTVYADFYRSLFSLMRQHGVRRIFAMGTISIHQQEDRWALAQFLIEWMVRIIASGPYYNIISIQKLFEDKDATRDIDWTVFRIGNILGTGDDHETWARNREDGGVYVGPLGAAGWSHSQKRARLTRWLVDAAESGATEWVHRMPAVSKLAGSE